MKRYSILFAATLLAGCQTATEALDEGDIRKTNLVESECAIYFTVAKQLTAQGQSVGVNLTEGCPPSSQTIVADIVPSSGTVSESRFNRIIYQRMIARGMPKEVADSVRQSKSFRDLVTQSDALYGN